MLQQSGLFNILSTQLYILEYLIETKPLFLKRFVFLKCSYRVGSSEIRLPWLTENMSLK